MEIKHRTFRLAMAGALSASLVGFAAPTMAQDQSWEDILAEAEGQTVNWFMWAGSDPINAYVIDWVGDRAQEFGVTVNQVPLTDTVDAVNTVLGEQQAGQDENGSVDMIWVNGENFKTGKQAGIWFCGWTESLPNFEAYVDPASVAADFGVPVDQCEAPWNRVQFTFTYNSDLIDEPPSTFDELVEWIKANPGMFTYPAPPDFTGSVFIRHLLYNEAGGPDDLLGEFDQATYDEVTPGLWDTLNDIESSLWRGGETYPASVTELEQLFSNGEVAMYMTYEPASTGRFIDEGIFPPSAKQFGFDDGTIANTNFVAIPYNSPNKAGAQVVANILLSPEAQLEKAIPAVWGAFPVIEVDRTDLAEDFASIEVHPSVLPPGSVPAVPELDPAWVPALEQGWAENVLQQ